MISAAYCSKELCQLLDSEGIVAHSVRQMEKGGSWYKKYTIDIALRWLREEYRIAVMPIPYRYPGKWKNILVYLGEPMEKDDKYDICELDDTYTSYEQAAEAGIRYVVTHIVAKIRKELAKQDKQ